MSEPMGATLRIGWRRELLPAHLRRRVTAALLAALAAVLVMASVSGSRGRIRVAVAAHDLAAGARLGAGDIAVVALPAAAAPSGVAHASQPLVGRVLASGVRAREPLTDTRFAASGAGADLRAGEVAAPVRLVDPSVGALLHPGATVDVLAAAGSPTGTVDADQSAARTVARRARILAVPAAKDAAGVGTSSGGTLVVLAVSREEAQLLAGAEASGRLSVVFDD